MALQSSRAQNSGFHFVTKAGLNLAKVTNLESDWKSGLNVGLGVEYLNKARWGLETGVYYWEYGAKNRLEHDWQLDGTISTVKRTNTTDITHIQVPLLFKYFIYKGINVSIGAQAAYRLDYEGQDNALYSLYGDALQYSALAGIGYQFDFGLLFNVQYVHGLNNLYSKSTMYVNGVEVVIPDLDVRNRALQFNIGWRF